MRKIRRWFGIGVLALLALVAVDAAKWKAYDAAEAWTIQTTPRYKGHAPQGMHAVCVSERDGAERIVPITPEQAYGPNALEQGAPCPG